MLYCRVVEERRALAMPVLIFKGTACNRSESGLLQATGSDPIERRRRRSSGIS